MIRLVRTRLNFLVSEYPIPQVLLSTVSVLVTMELVEYIPDLDCRRYKKDWGDAIKNQRDWTDYGAEFFAQ